MVGSLLAKVTSVSLESLIEIRSLTSLIVVATFVAIIFRLQKTLEVVQGGRQLSEGVQIFEAIFFSHFVK